jgi:hypothetical protein
MRAGDIIPAILQRIYRYQQGAREHKKPRSVYDLAVRLDFRRRTRKRRFIKKSGA